MRDRAKRGLSGQLADHEAVFKQAVLSHGRPRALYLDRGAAQRSKSLKSICAELGTELIHCQAYDAAAKGGVERIFSTIRAELLDELDDEPVSLTKLNSLLWSWLSVEYHGRLHEGTGKVPREHWLCEASWLRPAPRGDELDHIFLHRAKRLVRADGTVKFAGRLLEVRPELNGQWVELRFEPMRSDKLPEVYINRRFYCDTVELDVVSNSCRRRRWISNDVVSEPVQATGLDPLGDIQREHERRSRPVKKNRKTNKE